MKVYMFYLIGDFIDPKKYRGIMRNLVKFNPELNKQVTLYAFTPDKDVADHFKETRNMDLFRMNIVKMSRDEYENELNDLKTDQSSLLLEYHQFNTCSIDENNIYRKTTANVLATVSESDRIIFKSNMILKELFLNKITVSSNEEFVIEIMSGEKDIFTDEFNKEVMRKLNFSGLLSLMYPLELLPFDSLEVDQVALFCYLYGNTFKNFNTEGDVSDALVEILQEA